MKLGKKAGITEFLGGELVDEILEAGLALLLVMSGITYFNIKDKWVDAMQLIGQRVGLSSSESEISLMINTVTNTFPFNFIQQHQTWALVIGITLCIVGIVIKILTLKSKEEFIKDLGKIILVPGIIGVVAVVFIQIMTVNSLNDLLVGAQLVSTQLAFNQASSGIMLWNMMGLMFLIGFFGVIFGSMIYYITKSMGRKPVPLHLFGKFLVFVGWFSLLYYILIRVFAIEAIASSLYGENILKLFAFSWYIGRETFIVALCMFALGFTLYNYGNKAIRRKRKALLRQAKRERMILHQRPAVHSAHPRSH
ncbi:hypothetical protein GF345_02255 [Candidatus Woesearchaeota archaeon]|nr:hypothetical protein [Candidatus Woesearchaeota archaeon]